MKSIYFIALLLLFSINANSQVKKNWLTDTLATNFLLTPTILNENFPLQSFSQVRILPQDNMPCFVTDVSNIAPIPNAAKDFELLFKPSRYYLQK